MTKGPYKCHSLLHSVDILEKRLATLLTPVDITPRQARILNTLNRTGEVSQTVLTEQFDITSGSMSTMIDRFLKRGMIARQNDPDRTHTRVENSARRPRSRNGPQTCINRPNQAEQDP